ncbi:D-threo-3-hydroxyaspartate dehydratase-like [Mytilus californianus]|uniref:D-threo-3-hydroxyaspartate dehydratase-like n=1 Tax=Mytilus californianus TaxID=6549 RepID=UPI0022467A15|nr:D-threo-3-hydroxyaspartate dehydratase-like [Mytilus californianus]
MDDEQMPATISDVPTPSFLVDLDKVKKNAQKMTDTCERLGVQLRPHMKTHKTVELGTLMTNGTNRTIEVSTLDEAEFYAKNGFDDILYAHPLIAARTERCKNLAYKLESFHVMIENSHGLDVLLKSPLTDGKKWSVFLEVDDGSGRTGVPWDSDDVISLATMASQTPYIDFKGLYLYNGNTYKANCKEEIEDANKKGTDLLKNLYKRLTDNKIECRTLAIGNTPSCSRPHESMNVLTEFHPGNYIFYDVQQSTIGSCSRDEIACRLTTRVIGHKPSHNIFLIDCGFLALSYDGMADNPDDFSSFQDNPDLKIIGFSQEIGKVTTKSGEKLNYDRYPIGSQLFISPWHSCATACQHTVFYVHSGNKIVDMWRPTKGW